METRKICELVALSSGTGKNGKEWCRAILKGHTEAGKPVVREFFLPPECGKRLEKLGAYENISVYVVCGLDEYLRPGIIGIEPLDEQEVIA